MATTEEQPFIPEEEETPPHTERELFVGLVGPVGVDLDAVTRSVVNSLRSVEYEAAEIRITDILRLLPRGYQAVPDSPADARLNTLMTLGNSLCTEIQSEDAMAKLGVFGIDAQRQAMAEQRRRAYVLRQLKRPAEVRSLRRLYGEHFVLIAAYSPEATRIERLSSLIAASQNDMDHRSYRDRAYQLIKRDEDEEIENGQKLRDTFWRADLFVDPSDPPQMEARVHRFIELLFGRVISSPTRDEYAMFTAWGAAMRSASLARQVGSALYDERGSIIATGTNDVPRKGGGVYWEGDEDDARDHKLGYDHSDVRRSEMVAQVLHQLQKAGWLSEEASRKTPRVLAETALGPGGILKPSRAAAVMEYVRAVHAEQCAIADAAMRGVSTSDLRMAVTTFPCHECARLIVAAGISELLFVEPYPKSLAEQMYSDSISFDGIQDGRVVFRPFLGVAPQIYARLFSSEGMPRKGPDGSVVLPSAEAAQLRLTYQGSRLGLEDAEATFKVAIAELIEAGETRPNNSGRKGEAD